MEDREKMVQLKMELGAENAESGEGSGAGYRAGLIF